MLNEKEKSIMLVLIEDDPGDQKLIRMALASQGYSLDLKTFSVAEDAMEYLAGSIDMEHQELPGLILLDLNMPGMGGKEFLRWIKKDQRLCPIPVIVVTTSDSESDIKECYELQAAGFIQKMSIPSEFVEVMGKLTKYWFETSMRLQTHSRVVG